MTRNRTPDPKPWLTQLQNDKLTSQGSKTSSNIDLSPHAFDALLRDVLKMPEMPRPITPIDSDRGR